MRTITLFFLAFCCAACTHTNSPAELNDWSLVELRLDQTSAANRGVLPLWRSADASEFGQVPQAHGKMSISSEGRLVADVVVEEPILTLGGHRTVQTYRLLAFTGILNAAGKEAQPRDTTLVSVPLGIATRVTLEHEGRDRIVLRAHTGPKNLPYVFVFVRGIPRAAPVSVPMLAN